MDIKHLIGRTISGIKRKKCIHTDDTGYLEITFSDGLQIVIVADYTAYTGMSKDEYPTSIDILEKDFAEKLINLIDLPQEDMGTKL
jgi:hypothetical protein